MTPTREHNTTGPVIDTGIGSPVATRPSIWAPESFSASDGDTGVGTLPLTRADTLTSSNAFIPPLWLKKRN